MSEAVVVIGAGIVGTCCALALQRQGLSVLLIDKNEPGLGCSFGNAGMIQTGSVMPLAVPGILKRVPRMLLDPQGPLVLNWAQLPRLLPWMKAFLKNTDPEAVQGNAAALAALLVQSKAAYRKLSEGTTAPSVFRQRGELYVFSSEKSYANLASRWAMYRQYGIEYVEMSANELRAFEPQLSEHYRCGYYLPGSEYVVDPLRLTQSLFEAFTGAGGAFMRVEVQKLKRQQSGEVVITHQTGEIKASRLVIAAGYESGRLAKALGSNMPVEPLRGYHVMMPGNNIQLSGPVIEGDMNIAALPMPGGIRIAGTLEFAGARSAPRWSRAEMLAPMARKMLPRLKGEAGKRWYGYRPGTPDSLPVLGPAPGYANIWYAFGHGQLGLTLAAISGQLIAQMVTGQPPSIDITPYRPSRFIAAA